MTCPDPKVNCKGWPLGILESNSVPSSNFPYWEKESNQLLDHLFDKVQWCVCSDKYTDYHKSLFGMASISRSKIQQWNVTFPILICTGYKFNIY